MKTVDELQKEIENLEATKIKLTLELEEAKALTILSPVEELAVALHDILCTHNHTDGCEWYYDVKNGVHNWQGFAHKRYLEAAVKLCDKVSMSTEDIIFVVKTIKEVVR